MLKHLVHLNNEHSRAPLRPQETRARRLRSAARLAETRPVKKQQSGEGGGASAIKRHRG
jgi:hypothetical protein